MLVQSLLHASVLETLEDRCSVGSTRVLALVFASLVWFLVAVALVLTMKIPLAGVAILQQAG